MAKQFTDKDSPIEFPCQFPLKVIGLHSDDMLAEAINIVKKHAPDFNTETLKQNPSKQGNYLALTFTINATSQHQLDNLYRELSANPLIKMVL